MPKTRTRALLSDNWFVRRFVCAVYRIGALPGIGGVAEAPRSGSRPMTRTRTKAPARKGCKNRGGHGDGLGSPIPRRHWEWPLCCSPEAGTGPPALTRSRTSSGCRARSPRRSGSSIPETKDAGLGRSVRQRAHRARRALRGRRLPDGYGAVHAVCQRPGDPRPARPRPATNDADPDWIAPE